MAGQTVNANIAFGEFSRSISICIFTRLLGIFSFLFMISSGLSLLLCYCLLHCSKRVEQIVVHIKDVNTDTINVTKMTNATILSVGNEVNAFAPWNIINVKDIKAEVCTLYENAHTQTGFISDGDDMGMGNDSSSDDSDRTEDDTDDDSNNPANVSDVSTIQTLDTEPETNNIIADNLIEENTLEPNVEGDSDIEDVTEQSIAEREREREKQKIRDLIDLSSDSD